MARAKRSEPVVRVFTTQGSPVSERGLRSLLVVSLSILAETSLGFGSWHALLTASQSGIETLRRIRNGPVARNVKDALP